MKLDAERICIVVSADAPVIVAPVFVLFPAAALIPLVCESQ